MKNTTTRLILEKIKDAGEITIDILLPRHPKSRLTRSLLGLDSGSKINKQTLSSLLCRLRRQGLVERGGTKQKSFWSITAKGVKLLKDKSPLLYPKKDGVPRLVIFDIPEKERNKRDVVRAELIAHGYERLQKSVWLGRCPLSDNFITLMDNFNLAGKVHIFSIKDSGTIKTV